MLQQGTAQPLPCCSMQQQLACGPAAPPCLWCRANARNNLTLSVSPDLLAWRVVRTVMSDDSGLPEWAAQLWTGFQYADWVFNGSDILAAVRGAYRGAQCYHNSNRLLFQALRGWRSWL
jgi:hypothetical protein